jgi:hypothetical protein
MKVKTVLKIGNLDIILGVVQGTVMVRPLAVLLVGLLVTLLKNREGLRSSNRSIDLVRHCCRSRLPIDSCRSI